MKLNTKNPIQGVLEAAKAVDDLAWGFDDPIGTSPDASVTLAASVLLDLRWALTYLHERTEAERLDVPGPDVVEHPSDHPQDRECFCQECTLAGL